MLAQVQAQERKAARGKLRIYFGASAGVGKTYGMLLAARKLHAEGKAPLVGVIETHGRSDTAALLDGLNMLRSSALGTGARYSPSSTSMAHLSAVLP
ncbi:MAG: two-component system sensor histidine kinase KdbD [Massilia sp.]|nr:two-component system sensor histidine kinase KdbD [Massilia sp.]